MFERCYKSARDSWDSVRGGKLHAGPLKNSKHEDCPSHSELGGHVLMPDFDQIQAKIRRENQGTCMAVYMPGQRKVCLYLFEADVSELT
jgi:hypothetical protein